MKIAILGPVCKDYIKTDDEVVSQIGGIVYYTGVALKNLGADVIAYATYNEKDAHWIQKQFEGVELRHIPDENTLEGYVEFSRDNPDVRTTKIITFAEGVIELTETLIEELKDFDWIILAPLLHTNIPFELIEGLKSKNIAYGNFGIFTAYEDGKYVPRHPEKLVRALPYLQYVFLDINEAALVSGKRDINDIAGFFRNNGLKNLIITEGSKGSHVFAGEKYYQIPSFPPRTLIDPTGAGDNYVAGFIRALDLHNDPQEQGNFAAMVATISLEKSGTFNLTLKDVQARLAEESE